MGDVWFYGGVWDPYWTFADPCWDGFCVGISRGECILLLLAASRFVGSSWRPVSVARGPKGVGG